ncbi:hypothetical protein ES708_30177 [subsurface metagenome]
MSDSCRDRNSERWNMSESFFYRCSERHLHQLDIVAQQCGMSRSEWLRAAVDQRYRVLLNSGVISDAD